jgi:hypothetical protein
MIYPEKILPQANRIKINTISVGDFYKSERKTHPSERGWDVSDKCSD